VAEREEHDFYHGKAPHEWRRRYSHSAPISADISRPTGFDDRCMLSMTPRVARPGNLTHAELRSRSQEPHFMVMPATTHWTVDMVRALPDDGKRYEVIDGELFVTPAPLPPHQRAVRELLLRLGEYLRDNPTAEVMASPADISFDEHTLVQPDVFVVSRREGRTPVRWEEIGPLLLAVEILSPTTARADRHKKRRLYQRERIPEYWIVDVDARLFEHWRADDDRPEIVTERIEWRVDPAYAPLVIDLADYFRDVIGEHGR
jgi:Uma2 family endonuclease